MCNLYHMKRMVAEVAAAFRAKTEPGINVPIETYPGYPGLVVREDSGERVLQSMVWGFPIRLKFMKPESKPKPVNNIADLQKPMWKRYAVNPAGRCIIPVTAFAEAEGQKGSKTRTWFTVKDQPMFGWAALWRDSAEWGAVYSGVMTDCNEAIRPVHDRMPVLLMPDEYDAWLRGTFDDALAFQQRCFPDELIEIERTAEPWVKRREASA